jgi:hypothetical protein
MRTTDFPRPASWAWSLTGLGVSLTDRYMACGPKAFDTVSVRNVCLHALDPLTCHAGVDVEDSPLFVLFVFWRLLRYAGKFRMLPCSPENSKGRAIRLLPEQRRVPPSVLPLEAIEALGGEDGYGVPALIRGRARGAGTFRSRRGGSEGSSTRRSLRPPGVRQPEPH